MSKIVLVDCDGVLSDMTGSVLQLAREKAQVFDKTAEDITDWDYGTSLGWPGVNAAISEATAKREFVYRMRPYSGAFLFLRNLEAAVGKENVFVCTSPWNGEWAVQRFAWLADFASVNKRRVIMCSAKHLIPGFLIDDHAENLKGRPFNDAFLVARPHNVGAPFTRGTFKDAVDLFVGHDGMRQ